MRALQFWKENNGNEKKIVTFRDDIVRLSVMQYSCILYRVARIKPIPKYSLKIMCHISMMLFAPGDWLRLRLFFLMYSTL